MAKAKTVPGSSARQREIAAQVAQVSFTKYPRWFDPQSREMKALHLNPFYDICRKVQDHAVGTFPLYAIDPSWAGQEGRYAFVTYCFEHLPTRPTPFHKIRTIDGTEFLRPGNVHCSFHQAGSSSTATKPAWPSPRSDRERGVLLCRKVGWKR